MRTLVGLPYSPWTEKARWALDHHGIAYRFHDHLPMIGEPFLRMRAGRYRQRTTVPLLLDGDLAVGDSFEIARLAERIGGLARLFPDGEAETIQRWNDLSERVLESARALVLHRMAKSAAAQEEALPAFVPGPLRRFATPMTKTALGFLARKHASAALISDAERTIASALAELGRALGGRSYLLDRFSYADIVMAVVLQIVEPVKDHFIALGPATRECWRTASLAEEYSDLVAWRDELYDRHRKRTH
jgi:glutathione S-transferase